MGRALQVESGGPVEPVSDWASFLMAGDVQPLGAPPVLTLPPLPLAFAAEVWLAPSQTALGAGTALAVPIPRFRGPAVLAASGLMDGE